MATTIETVTIMSEAMTISLLVWRRFRRPMPGLVEAIYEANPGLATTGAFVPLGAVVAIPIPEEKPVNEATPVRLWG